ncbi:hypothetical protein EJB05_44733, partial [Eragrostis curvula]
MRRFQRKLATAYGEEDVGQGREQAAWTPPVGASFPGHTHDDGRRTDSGIFVALPKYAHTQSINRNAGLDMMDGQQDIQLAALPPQRGSSSPVLPEPTPLARVADMCPALYRALRSGRIEDVMSLLLRQHGAAAKPDDDQATEIMLQHGRCDVLELSAEGNTVLHVAAEHGHGELIQELQLRFRDNFEGLVTSENSALDTPLHCAARAGSGNNAVEILVQLATECGEGRIFGCKNMAGDTALHLAARHGHDEAVEALVTVAPAVAAELNNAGVSPMYLAVMSGSKSALRSIGSHCRDASWAGPGSQNALHAAVFQSKEMVELLLEWRPAVADEVDCDGSTPLHFASSDGNHSVVRAILRRAQRRTMYKKDATGLTALHIAALMGHDHVVKELLDSCPDAAELKDGSGGTFLHAAAKENRSSVVRLAVKDPKLCGLLNAQDMEGNTPLHLAVAAGAPYVVDTLLRNSRVRNDVLNNAGHTAFDLVALSTSYFTMVSLVVTLVVFKAQHRPQRQDHLRPWNCAGIVQGIKKTSDSLVVVVVLIATAAFAAGFNLPGGYDDGNGKANLKDNTAFKSFLFLDTFAAATSVVSAILLVYGMVSGSAGKWKSFVASLALQFMWVSLIFLLLAFYAALVAVAGKEISFYVLLPIQLCINLLIVCLMTRFAPATTQSWMSFLWQSCFWKRRSTIKRRYPSARTSMTNLFVFWVTNIIVLTVFITLLIL